jgi:SulP family sulfate permease
VALALVPEAVAFAFVAGVHPLVGLYAAFIVGLVTALIGGRPGMISGATGALAVVMVSLVATHGVEYLFATVVLMGILQLAAAFSGGQVHPAGAASGDAGLRQRARHRDLSWRS